MKRLLIYTSMTNSTVLQIRKIIFENFNEIDLRFNNDEIYELLKKNEIFDIVISTVPRDTDKNFFKFLGKRKKLIKRQDYNTHTSIVWQYFALGKRKFEELK